MWLIIFSSSNYFKTDVESVDFARAQEAANAINAWCANVTKNHIKDIVSTGMYARLEC